MQVVLPIIRCQCELFSGEGKLPLGDSVTITTYGSPKVARGLVLCNRIIRKRHFRTIVHNGCHCGAIVSARDLKRVRSKGDPAVGVPARSLVTNEHILILNKEWITSTREPWKEFL